MTSPQAHLSSATQTMRDNVVHQEDAPIIFDYVPAQGPDGIRFDVWFGNTHLPSLMEGYPRESLRCYAVPARSSYLSVIELPNQQKHSFKHVDAATFPASVAKHERFLGEPLGITKRREGWDPECIDNAIAYPAFLTVPHEKMDEVGRWYQDEHLPILMAGNEWLMTRRFRIVHATGTSCTHLAIHYLTSLKALASPERDLARDTPWRDALLAQGWFAPEYRVSYPMGLRPY